MSHEPYFSFEEITISAPRYGGGSSSVSLEVDITTSVVELNLYESIYSPYITGDLTLVDTNGIIGSAINIQGQEYLNIRLRVHQRTIETRMVIRRIQTQSKAIGNSSSVYVLDLIEEHGYISYFKRLQRSYTGNISYIAQAIFEQELAYEIQNDNITEAAQNIKILACNRTPLGLCKWIMDRATDEEGSPMFLYSSLKDGVKIRSLQEMLADRPLDIVFAHAHINPAVLETTASRTIKNISIVDNDDIIAMAQAGAIRSTYISIDPLTASIDFNEFSMTDHHEELFGEDNQRNTLFVEDFEVAGVPVKDLPSNYISQINTSDMFDDAYSYHEDSLANHKKKISRRADLMMLDKQRYEITLNGIHFLQYENNTSIGVVIQIFVPKDMPNYDQPEEELRDEKRSGEFLLTNTRHTFNIDNDYTVVASVARLAQPDNINDEERNR